jgi:hypothetical protein
LKGSGRLKRAIVVLLILALSISLLGCNKELKTKDVTVNNQKVENGKTTDDIDIADVPIEIVLNSTEIISDEEYGLLEEGYNLLVINLTIKNPNNWRYDFYTTNVYLLVDGEKIFGTYWVPEDTILLESKIMEPGEELQGAIIFELKRGAEFKVVYDDYGVNNFIIE